MHRHRAFALSLLGPLASTLLALLPLLVVACSDGSSYPPLGDEPSVSALRKHATRYCDRLQECAPGETDHEECITKLMTLTDTPIDRREAGQMFDNISVCMASSCVEMTTCITTNTARRAAEKARSPSAPGSPPAP